MTVTATESDHTTAVLAVMETGGAVPYTVQDANRVVVLPPGYNVITLEPRAGGTFRQARSTRRGYRLAVESRGQTYDQAQAMREAADRALRGVELVIDGLPTTPLVFESGQPIDEDTRPGWYSGLLLLTYTH